MHWRTRIEEDGAFTFGGSIRFDNEELAAACRSVVVIEGDVEVGAGEVRIVRAREPFQARRSSLTRHCKRDDQRRKQSKPGHEKFK